MRTLATTYLGLIRWAVREFGDLDDSLLLKYGIYSYVVICQPGYIYMYCVVFHTQPNVCCVRSAAAQIEGPA